VTVTQEDAKAWYDLHAIMSDLLTARAADYDVRDRILWTPDLERKTGFLAGIQPAPSRGPVYGKATFQAESLRAPLSVTSFGQVA